MGNLSRSSLLMPLLGLGTAMVLNAQALERSGAPTVWRELAEGMALGEFETDPELPVGDAAVSVLRIDPDIWEFRVLCISELGLDRGVSAKQWSDEFGLDVVTNAGMFGTDYRTHIGYLRNGDHVNNSNINDYMSVAAFGPRDGDDPPFRIFDLDEVAMSKVRARYNGVIQNLRLIKRDCENRWSPQNKKWSEAALGEDAHGNILLIFCRSPHSMHDLNEILLSLPIDLVCAQHLEGGPEAQLFIRLGETTRHLVGSYETGFNENDDSRGGHPIPNVIGVVRR